MVVGAFGATIGEVIDPVKAPCPSLGEFQGGEMGVGRWVGEKLRTLYIYASELHSIKYLFT